MAKNEKIIGIKQIESEATYSVWLNGDDYFIDWNWNADKIKRKIDACCSPYEGAKCRINDEVIIILEADVVADVKVENRMQGKVLFIKDDCPIVICGEGLLQIKKAIYKNSSKMLLPLNNFRIKFE
jgi:methionyl-tRNA formyltransferase